MNERELLELAAKAAGIPLKPDFAERFDYYMADRLMWNPLTDDGDALRLAVKLNLVVSCAYGMSAAVIETGAHEDVAEFHHESDPYAATRRAITRAAAEIGKGME